ncbi:unnamed protein product [Spodoptera exigua]|nr:unnamed protein product [Spodoptera exigua]
MVSSHTEKLSVRNHPVANVRCDNVTVTLTLTSRIDVTLYGKRQMLDVTNEPSTYMSASEQTDYLMVRHGTLRNSSTHEYVSTLQYFTIDFEIIIHMLHITAHH